MFNDRTVRNWRRLGFTLTMLTPLTLLLAGTAERVWAQPPPPSGSPPAMASEEASPPEPESKTRVEEGVAALPGDALPPLVAKGAAPTADSLAAGLPFRPGERLEFSLEYGLVRAGTAWLEVGAVENLLGRPCVELSSRARSAEAFDVIYKVDDRVSSAFDLQELYTWRFDRHIREGSYEKDEAVIFDPVNRIARYDDGKIYRTPERAQDILSALYYLRTQELTPGKSVLVPTHASRKNYDLEIKVLREESVTTPLGTFDCVVVEPQLQSEGVFRQQGHMKIWLTRDARHIPVLMKSKVVIGHVTALLSAWSGVDPPSADQDAGSQE